jgi:hypothetical protein
LNELEHQYFRFRKSPTFGSDLSGVLFSNEFDSTFVCHTPELLIRLLHTLSTLHKEEEKYYLEHPAKSSPGAKIITLPNEPDYSLSIPTRQHPHWRTLDLFRTSQIKYFPRYFKIQNESDLLTVFDYLDYKVSRKMWLDSFYKNLELGVSDENLVDVEDLENFTLKNIVFQTRESSFANKITSHVDFDTCPNWKPMDPFISPGDHFSRKSFVKYLIREGLFGEGREQIEIAKKEKAEGIFWEKLEGIVLWNLGEKDAGKEFF